MQRHSVDALAREVSQLVETDQDISLADIAYTAYLRQERSTGSSCGAVVASTVIELLDRLAILHKRIQGDSSDGPPRLTSGNDTLILR